MRTIDLFSGCGGMSLGFQNAGAEILAAYDNWKPAIDVYEQNFDHPIHNVDLSSEEAITDIRNLNPDLIVGGPPCQDFSSAGHRNEKLGRADLTVAFANIVSEVRPNYFVMENVSTITKSPILPKIVSTLKGAGYGLTQITLDASFCGVPQKRKRFFLIGIQGAEDNVLYEPLTKKLGKKPMTIFDYLGNSLGLEYYFRVPRSYSRRGIFSIHEPSMTIRGVDRPVPKGYPGHPNDPIAVTEDLRGLTAIERSYLQTFPTTFNFTGSKTNLNQMIGNAVPVKLAEFIATSLLEYHQNLGR
ncbi:DNA cytosine methyltransferase [Chitinophaga sancti]|uniref:DNA cytosine methyltransferase n=1 Tax=Chitinophaga sancti TaxID=1004 RepID=UPI002A7620DE|nr:DNA cytosine methyltransferase [Chitinophaga sancti]WPQ63415.1 DNA cytosine methyltransferase [Chitinophaga sancti]